MSAPNLQPDDLVANRFRVRRQVPIAGRAVFEAVDTTNEALVALHWTCAVEWNGPEALERFMVEVRTVGGLQHPSILPVHDVVEHEGHLYVATAPVTGASLQAQLDRGPIDSVAVLSMALPIMEALAAAHDRDIVHGRINPGCIFVQGAEHGHPPPQLLDFGLVRLKTSADGTNASVGTQQFGAYSWLAPEQMSGGEKLEARVDVYSVALILYRLISGRMPIDAQNALDLALRIGRVAPAPLKAPGVSAELARVIDAALSSNPAQRPGSMKEFVAALQSFAPARAPATLREPGKASRPVHRREDLLAGIAALKKSEGSSATPSTSVRPAPVAEAGAVSADKSARISLRIWLLSGAALLALVAIATWFATHGSSTQRSEPAPGAKAPAVPASAKPSPAGAAQEKHDNSDWER